VRSLQHVRRQILCLVDDQHRVPPVRVRVQQVGIDAIDEYLDARIARRVGDAEFVADARQELGHRQPGIENVGDVAGVGNLLQQAAAHRRLARAHLTGQQDEPAIAAQTVKQMSERLLVAAAHVEITRIGRDGKWRFGKAEIALVHGISQRNSLRHYRCNVFGYRWACH
jgi:hypothetical protein